MLSRLRGVAGGRAERARLDVVKQKLDAHHGERDASLQVCAQAAQELRAVMDIEVARGADNHKLLRSIEQLGDRILQRVGSHLTAEAMGEDDFSEVADTALNIAKVLDATRATKSSLVIDAKLEQLAWRLLSDVTDAVNKVKDHVADLASGVERVLETMEVVHGKAPRSKRIADLLLQNLQKVSARMLQMLPRSLALAVKASTGAQVSDDLKKAGEHLDALATELATVMESTWSPLLLPEVRKLMSADAARECNKEFLAIEKALKGDVEGLAEVALALGRMRLWWADAPSTELSRLEAACKAMDDNVASRFEAALARDMQRVEALLSVAKDIDATRAKFDIASVSETSLRARLLTVGGVSDVAKHLDDLDAELEKSDVSYASMVMVVQVLTAIGSVWRKAVTLDKELPARLTESLAKFESRILDADSFCEVAEVPSLLRSCARYDALKIELAGGKKLMGRFAPLVARNCLRVVESELAKTGGLNAKVVLLSLGVFKLVPLRATVEEPAIHDRLETVFDLAHKRIVSSFTSLHENEGNKRVALSSFAQKLDEFRVAVQLVPEGSCSLAQHLDVVGKLQAVQQKVRHRDSSEPEVLFCDLAALRSSCKFRSLSSEIGEQIHSWQEPLREMFIENLAGGAPEEAVRACTKEIDTVLQISSFGDGVGFSESLRNAFSVSEKLAILDKELKQESGPNLNAVHEALAALAPLHAAAAGDSFRRRVSATASLLERRLTSSCARAVAVCDSKQVQSLLAFARRLDQEGGDIIPVGLHRAMCLVAVSSYMSAASEELGKEVGMNPNVVLDRLKSVVDLWPEMGDATEELRVMVLSIRDTIEQRMLVSVQTAVASGSKAKMDALFKFAGDYDAVFRAIGSDGCLVEHLTASLSGRGRSWTSP